MLFRIHSFLKAKSRRVPIRQQTNSNLIHSPFAWSLLGAAVGGFAVYTLTVDNSIVRERVEVPVGHVGVVEFSGKVDSQFLPSGRHWIRKRGGSKCHLFDVRTKLLHLIVDVPSKEGLNISVEVAALYHLNPSYAPSMFELVGVDYEGIVVQPQFRAAIKQVCTGFDAKDFYHANTLQEISSQLSKLLANFIEKRGIVVEEIVVKKITLPNLVQEAIEQKMKMEQEMQQMEFVLKKEESEAQRKAIEAKGVADFQRIVSEGISEELLLWKGIEATENLATSNNTKVVVIGKGEHGLPVILGAESDSGRNNKKMKKEQLDKKQDEIRTITKSVKINTENKNANN